MRLVVKVGSSVITREDGRLNLKVIANLVDQIGRLREMGHEVLLVSSGAVAAGRAVEQANTDDARVLASLGQVKLISIYDQFLANYRLATSQLLFTKQDFRNRANYVSVAENLRSILSRKQIVPIINENDVLRSKENEFTDNDELAGYVAGAVGADLVVILTSVKGLYTGDPELASSQLVEEVHVNDVAFATYVQGIKSRAGRGGMVTKFGVGLKLAKLGIDMYIVHGNEEDVVLRVIQGENPGTRFVAAKGVSALKKWLANSSDLAQGKLVVNKGAAEALQHDLEANSLLPVGIVEVKGDFGKGDVVVIVNEVDEEIGVGRTSCSSTKVQENIGKQGKGVVVHYDRLYLY